MTESGITYNLQLISKENEDAETYNVDYYSEKVDEVFRKFEIDGEWSLVGIEKNVQVNLNNKKELNDMFRTHPAWDEKNKALVFNADFHRSVDVYSARSTISSLVNYISDYVEDRGILFEAKREVMSMIRAFGNAFHSCGEELISQAFVNCFADNVASGTKTPKEIIEDYQFLRGKLRVGVKVTKLKELLSKNAKQKLKE